MDVFHGDIERICPSGAHVTDQSLVGIITGLPEHDDRVAKGELGVRHLTIAVAVNGMLAKLERFAQPADGCIGIAVA